MSENIYLVQEWAKVRQDEVVRFTDNFKIHECFLSQMTINEFKIAFEEIWNIYINIYGNIIDHPETFGMPLHEIGQYAYSSKEARVSRKAAYRPFQLLYNILVSGAGQEEGTVVVDVKKFKEINKVKKIYLIFERLTDFGFYFKGLKNNKITNNNVTITYPDNEQVLIVLKLMADKAYKTNRVNDLLACHYKLFQDDMDTVGYGHGVDIIADKMHTDGEKEFIYAMDSALTEMGYYSGSRESNEGPGYAYYSKQSEIRKKGPYHYLLSSNKVKLRLYLRIRNVTKCLDYLKDCPNSVKDFFLSSDSGCSERFSGTCKYGQKYTIDESSYWRCGCSSAPFSFSPNISDITHYLKLVELGLNK